MGSNSTTVFVDPALFIREYNDLPIGSKFTVHVNVSGVANLFTWQINLTWNKAILNVSRIIPGEFLNRTDSANKTSSAPRHPFGGLGYVINVTDNAKGYTLMAESILEDVLPGAVPGINGTGRLVSVEFLVVGYGRCNLTINVGGTLSTMLLNSTGGRITFTKTNGYFSNKFTSDIRGPAGPPDGVVDGWDYGFIGLAFGKTSASPDWETYKIADTRGPTAPYYLPDGIVDGWDYGYCGLQFGKHI
jgi:hypothetical protein